MYEPKLRFTADDGSKFPDWEEKVFGNIADYKKGPFGSALKKEIFVPKTKETVKVYEQQNAIYKDWKLERYFISNEYYQSKMKSFGVSGGDIIISCAGTIGEIYELPDDAENGVINQALMRVRIKKRIINSIIFKVEFDKMISTVGAKISNGSALKNIPPFADMKKQPVILPSLPEQQKIADFLSTIDTVIEKQKATVEVWEERKKGVMQKLFSQNVRFKADDGSEFPDWEEKKVANLFSKIKEKNKDSKIQNVITNSAEFGLINQRDFFDKDIAVEGKKENYTIIKTGDFVYNPRKSKQAPYGPFNCYQLEEDGIVSPLYTCLRPKGIVNAYYLFWYFQSGAWYRFIYENGAQNGARHDRVGMTDSLMQDIPVYVPRSLEEQQKIADCLSSLDDVIKMQKATLTVWKEMKKGLLQQMFV